jgi:hypothetical protein
MVASRQGASEMYVIVSTRGSRRWLSGVFRDAREAEACCSSLSNDERVLHTLHPIRPKQFPFFVLEARSGFTFLDPAEAEQAIAHLSAPDPGAEQILFAILSEYVPDVAGRDEMGHLPHVHLDEITSQSFVDWVRSRSPPSSALRRDAFLPTPGGALPGRGGAVSCRGPVRGAVTLQRRTVKPDDDTSVSCGSLIFTRERAQKLRAERKIFSVAREDVRRVRIHRASASQYPVRESIWAAGLAIVGVSVVRSGLSTTSWTTVTAGLGVGSLAIWMAVHLLRRITLVTLDTAEGAMRVDVDAHLSTEELQAVRKALHDKLDWPVVFEF